MKSTSRQRHERIDKKLPQDQNEGFTLPFSAISKDIVINAGVENSEDYGNQHILIH